MIEVEIRGPLSNEEFNKLDSFLESNAKKIKDFNKLVIFYHAGEKHNFPIGTLRIKKDDKDEKLVFKTFDVGAQEINREIEVKLKDDGYKNMIQILKF